MARRVVSRRRPGPDRAARVRRHPVAGILILLGFASLAITALWALAVDLPEAALSPASVASLRVLDRDGRLLREVLTRPDGRSTWVPLRQISPHLIQATLASEDHRFFEHPGLDGRAMLRALAQALWHREVRSGASTVTMQLARLLVPLPHSLGGKLRQIALAFKLEDRLSKETILWQYLNRAPYGNGTLGIEAAARGYLGRPASQLSLAEAALLAALPRGPSRYDPFRRRADLLARQRTILHLMHRRGLIDEQALRLALRQPIDWDAAKRPFLAPHFVERILAQTLPRAAGSPSRITTTLSLPVQQRVEAAVARTLADLKGRGVSNAAVLVLDTPTGEVLAYVGSGDFFDEAHDGQVDGTLALRQPGSAIKPFTYALGLEMGLGPASLLQDLPAHFPTEKGDYAPRNYDDRFHGPVRLRVALGSSYNVPAVRLAAVVGVDRLLRRLRDLGMQSLRQTSRFYGLGLTLGNGEVTLQDLTAAYATLARGGHALPLRLVREVEREDGRRLVPPSPSGKRLFSRQVAFLVSDILADPMARLPAFGARSVLSLGMPAAVKTGTSKDFRDNWTIGYTPLFTVGVWVGNFDGSSMHRISGISGAGPLWAEVMRGLMEGREAGFSRPSGLRQERICPLSGELAGPHCPSAITEFFSARSRPRTCSFHRLLRLDRENGLLAGPGCPEAEVETRSFVHLPAIYQAWGAAHGFLPPVQEGSPRCPPEARPGRPAVAVSAPQAHDRFFVDPDLDRAFQTVPLEAVVEGSPLPKGVQFLVDGQLVATAPFPYQAHWRIVPGRHTIVARLPDGRTSAPVVITVE